MKKVSLLAGLACLVLVFSCKKPTVGPIPQQQQQHKLVTAQGTPDGPHIIKTINAATGGSIRSVDGRINIDIPAGALAANQAITIQTITNATGVGLGKAYRITPHDIQFSKPVSISFNYTDSDVVGTAPEFLAIAYQDNTGAWQMVNGAQVDKAAKKITVTTTHFSDWGFFPLLYINPREVRMQQGERVNLSVMYLADPNDIDVPSGPTTSLNEPFVVSDVYVKKWTNSGIGTLTQTGARAVYQAPAKVATQTVVAVNAEIHMQRKGMVLLVSNITIESQFHIDYMQVDETEVNTPVVSYISRLYIYGKFGADPGEGKRSVKINNINGLVSTWAPTLIVCEIPAIGIGSSGNVVVTSGEQTTSRLLNEWTIDLNYEKVECPGGSLTKNIQFVIRLRGDALDYGSTEVNPIITHTDLNKSSKAIINVQPGSYNNNVNNEEACGNFKVEWAQLKDFVEERKLMSAGHTGFRGQVEFTATGFVIKLRLESGYALKSTRTFSPCRGPVDGPTVYTENFSLGGYEQNEIELTFGTNTSNAVIKAGSMPIETGTGPAIGLFWNAVEWPGVQQTFTTKMSWSDTAPKFN